MSKVVSAFIAVIITFLVTIVPVNATSQYNQNDFVNIPFVDEIQRPNIDFAVEPTTDGAVIKFDKLSTYSAYPIIDENSVNINKFFAFPVSMTEYGNDITIDSLMPNRNYTFNLYEGEEPDDINLISEITFRTKMVDDLDIDISSSSSKKITLEWKSDNYGVIYHLYRSSDNENFEEIYEGVDNSYTDSDVSSGNTYYYYISAVASTDETVKSNVVKARTAVVYGLPDVSGKCKTWAHYQAVTATGSPQYKLLHSDSCYTDYDTGIRMVDGCYCIALGSYYGTKVGTKYHITLSSGNEFDAILCDQKADRHTNATHQYAVNNNDIIEFYIDARYKPSRVGGDYGVLPQFSGSVVSIEKIE